MNIPKGYKLVPVEPTEEMLSAVWSVINSNGGYGTKACYEAMLAAAPTPPQPIYEEAEESNRFNDWACGAKWHSEEGTNYNWERFDIPYEKLEDIWQEFAKARAKAVEDELIVMTISEEKSKAVSKRGRDAILRTIPDDLHLQDDHPLKVFIQENSAKVKT